jgi:DNA-binding NtrC family response regulator
MVFARSREQEVRAMTARPTQITVDASEAGLEELIQRARESGRVGLHLRAWIATAEAWRIREALRECNGNRTAAARALGIGRRTLYNKMTKLCLVPRWTA